MGSALCIAVGRWRFERVVAVKVLTVELDEDRARFVREQQAMARLTGHPNIVPVLQVGETASGHPFLVMPYCGQGSIQERIDRLGVLEVAEVLRLGVKMAGALGVCASGARLCTVMSSRPTFCTPITVSRRCVILVSPVPVAGLRQRRGCSQGRRRLPRRRSCPAQPPSAASDVYGLGASLFAALTGHVGL